MGFLVLNYNFFLLVLLFYFIHLFIIFILGTIFPTRSLRLRLSWFNAFQNLLVDVTFFPRLKRYDKHITLIFKILRATLFIYILVSSLTQKFTCGSYDSSFRRSNLNLKNYGYFNRLLLKKSLFWSPPKSLRPVEWVFSWAVRLEL